MWQGSMCLCLKNNFSNKDNDVYILASFNDVNQCDRADNITLWNQEDSDYISFQVHNFA